MSIIHNDIVLYLRVSPNLQQDDGLFVRPGDLLPVFQDVRSRLWRDTNRRENSWFDWVDFGIICSLITSLWLILHLTILFGISHTGPIKMHLSVLHMPTKLHRIIKSFNSDYGNPFDIKRCRGLTTWQSCIHHLKYVTLMWLRSLTELYLLTTVLFLDWLVL